VNAYLLFLLSVASHAAPRLHDAIRAGEIPRIRWMLEQGDDLDERVNGFTAIELAQELKRDDIVALLTAHAAHNRIPRREPRGIAAVASAFAQPFRALARPIQNRVIERQRQEFRNELTLAVNKVNIPKKGGPVLGVPDDVWSLICLRVSPVDLARMQRVCTRFWHVAHHVGAPLSTGGLGRPYDLPYVGMIQLPGGAPQVQEEGHHCSSPMQLAVVDGILYIKETIMRSYRNGNAFGSHVERQPVYAIDPSTLAVDGPLQRRFPPDEQAAREELDRLRIVPQVRQFLRWDESRRDENSINIFLAKKGVRIGDYWYDARVRGELVISALSSPKNVTVNLRHPSVEVLGEFNGFVYVNSVADTWQMDTPRDVLVAFNVATGEQVAEIEVGRRPEMPIAVGNYLFVASREDGVSVISIETQKVIATIKTTGKLAVVGEHLFVGDDKLRVVYYYDISAFQR
jgi:hypothetical protein